ncbi:tyrosine recombinase XerC [Hydrogenovibrio marinus]|uniref:tyrosine recombinase XerC n=1 Tax=Hydrogenovibrio marinus TaxID=28885 RepID=UPI0004A6BFFE|nr:tyrosine recombinase XerC [Hydrogenovibrio marinus]BBN60378.1 tyrosine recombinase XerC [Hydrogenovibrio marinus]
MSKNQFSEFVAELTRLNRSPETIENYERDMVAFLRFFQGDFLAEEIENSLHDHRPFIDAFQDWQSVSVEAIQAFVASRMEAGIHPRTLSRNLSALRTFYQFLIEHNWAFANPAKSVKAPKQPKPLPKSLDIDLTQQLLEQPLNTWQDIRDQAMFECLYSAGLRVSELADLDLSPGLDQMSEGWVKVLGKGSKERISPLGSKAIAALQRWLSIRDEHAKGDEQAVFVNKFGNRLSVRSIQQRLDQRTLQAGLPTKMSPHRLRHACATHVLESSGDLRAVQDLLGHANLSTTQIYTKLDLQHLAKVYDTAHPRAKKSGQNK